MIGRMVVAATTTGIVILLGGSAAGADGQVGVSIVAAEDDAIYPGSHVNVLGTCDAPDFTTARVVSPVLDDASDLRGRGGHDPTVVGDARVKLNAAPGVWPVSFRCGSVTVTGYLRIVPPLAAMPRLHGSEIEALLAGVAAAVVFMAGLMGLVYRGRKT